MHFLFHLKQRVISGGSELCEQVLVILYIYSHFILRLHCNLHIISHCLHLLFLRFELVFEVVDVVLYAPELVLSGLFLKY